MIPEPQRTYLLELLTALGVAGDGLILAGAQAMRFAMSGPRPTRDFDFVLDVALLRESHVALSSILTSLRYEVVESARNFQFEKRIPNSNEVMRIEFMAPIEYGRGSSEIRVDVQSGIHGRACVGGLIVLRETDNYEVEGFLPSGDRRTATVRVTRPHALVMMKCLAMNDRYRGLRGAEHTEHDRNEARIHAGDIVAILRAQRNFEEFRGRFRSQFQNDTLLKERVYEIVQDYFSDEAKPGLVLYGELIAAALAGDPTLRERLASEIRQAHRLVISLMP